MRRRRRARLQPVPRRAAAVTPVPAAALTAAGEPVAAPASLRRAVRLGHRVGGDGGAVVRRKLKRWKPSSESEVPEDYEAVDDKVKEVDAAVDAAHGNVAAQLKAGKPAQLDGVSDSRYSWWLTALESLPDNLKASATGYVIEDHATHAFRSDPMVTLQLTGELRNSRPDVVVRDPWAGDPAPTGYLDVTSTGDAAHIFEKKGDWGRQPYVVESLYPSFDFSDLQNTPLEISEDDLAKVEEWRMNRALRRWAQVQRAYESRKLGYEYEQDNVVAKLENLSAETRTRLRDPGYEVRTVPGSLRVRLRRPRYRYDPYGRRDVNPRWVTELRGRMQKAGVEIDRGGGIHRIPFDSKLDMEGVAYTWEYMEQIYGLA